jgi:hypothetical protein
MTGEEWEDEALRTFLQGSAEGVARNRHHREEAR